MQEIFVVIRKPPSKYSTHPWVSGGCYSIAWELKPKPEEKEPSMPRARTPGEENDDRDPTPVKTRIGECISIEKKKSSISREKDVKPRFWGEA